MSRAWAGGSTRRWRRDRATVLARDGHRCQLKLPGCSTVATEVHHVLGKGVSDDPADCLAACQPCNLAAGDPRASDPAPRPVTRW